jgi:hypothetical protein
MSDEEDKVRDDKMKAVAHAIAAEHAIWATDFPGGYRLAPRVPVDQINSLTADAAVEYVIDAVKNGAVSRDVLVRLVDTANDLLRFDARWHLTQYPDVADAAQSGRFKSAWEHYAFRGRSEGRFAAPP